jgi:hypothetical protein
MRRPSTLVVFFFLVASAFLRAQSTNASLTGRVTDPSKALIVGARVAAVSDGTNSRYGTTTNHSGEYYLPNLPPDSYRIEVEKSGFKKLIKPDVNLHVQDALEVDFEMPIGVASDSITVEAGAPLLNTSSATVSTLIDHRFVENMPLNGRSFGSLIDLTPGVVLVPSNFQEQGQFSVNGQRPDANYFTVDGVSANLGSAGSGSNFGQSGAGQLPATSAFGGMSNLASLDALQEFRIQTSTFAPEFGRTPGAQIAVVTKSGTNIFHGTVFEYFRNDVLDANDWFADNKGLRKPELRQNDFGGVLGGPIKKDRLFFFGSYEGLRVRQPNVASTYVPSLTTIQNAPPAVQPLLNAFPKPNGPDFGNGTAGFSATYSDPSSLDSYSGKIDYLLSSKVTIFGRYSDAPSQTQQRTGGTLRSTYSNVAQTKYRTQALTVGSTQVLSARLNNEFRFNYSRNRAESIYILDDFGGAVPPPNSVLYPVTGSPQTSAFEFFGDFNPFGLVFLTGEAGNNLIQQFNVTDNTSWVIGSHEIKLGLDYRRLNAGSNYSPYLQAYVFGSLPKVLSNSAPLAEVVARFPSAMIFSNWSIFAQDAWKATRLLTVTYGLRWEYNTSPSSSGGDLFTVTGLNNLATMQLAPPGTPLWHPQKDDFAPRLGLAWQAHSDLVIRAGAGVFYDLGYSQIANLTSAFPFAQLKLFPNTPFPLSAANATPPKSSTSPPVQFLVVVDPNHVLPRTYEWNAAIEQGFGKSDVLSLTYVGASGRKLMRRDVYQSPNPNFTGEFDVLSNAGTSSYNALQAQCRHRLSRGLQTLLSYTWGHSIDDVSSDANFQNVPLSKTLSALERGPSDYDIRNTFSGAISYGIPGPGSGLLKQIFGSWSTDSIIYARSAPPVNVVTGKNPFGGILSGANSVQRPNVNPGVPFYLSQANAPGGQVINAAAFSTPVPATAQGNLGRNALRGFGATQWDMTLRRQFRFTERISLQARGDFFNILNHPNFGSPINFLTSPQFGQSTQMLNNYLGTGGQSGGLNPLYQIGGPRSIQLALKLQF